MILPMRRNAHAEMPGKKYCKSATILPIPANWSLATNEKMIRGFGVSGPLLFSSNTLGFMGTFFVFKSFSTCVLY
jgi:hypothetical protein